MTVEVKIIGFDRSDRPTQEVDVPLRALDRVKAIAAVPLSDPDLLGAYELNERQVKMIAEAAHVSIPFKADRSYFLEAFEVA